MMKLYLLRHGLAVDADEADLKDEDRPLTPEGREKTIQAARGMRRLEIGIDLILTSPLPRAMETAALTARTLVAPTACNARSCCGRERNRLNSFRR
jgi:phosphohistidine phosphatase